MAPVVALDVAILPPPDVSARAVEYSAALPALNERRSAEREQVEGPALSLVETKGEPGGAIIA